MCIPTLCCCKFDKKYIMSSTSYFLIHGQTPKLVHLALQKYAGKSDILLGGLRCIEINSYDSNMKYLTGIFFTIGEQDMGPPIARKPHRRGLIWSNTKDEIP